MNKQDTELYSDPNFLMFYIKENGEMEKDKEICLKIKYLDNGTTYYFLSTFYTFVFQKCEFVSDFSFTFPQALTQFFLFH